ncbi:MAG: penicillin acylase family protein, partial [Chloroflexi bacterium]|nr:penicillin acylase family protein [Chloroflexota bacterium]
HCRTIGEACPFDVVGVSFPGAPAVVLGHNARIAWGATNAGPDVMDLFAETVDPGNPDAYLYRGESVPFETRTETIAVAGGEPVTITVRSTVHGPILSDVDDRLKGGSPVALRWTTLVEPDGTFESIYRLNLAQDFEQFRAAFRTWGAPSQNFVYADVDGRIGYQLPGKIPIRSGVETGDRIRAGASGEQDWDGWIPFEELPWQLDPAPGFIVSANNAAVDAGYPHYIAADWDRGERAARIIELLTAAAEGDGVTLDEMSAIQNDTYLLRADLVTTQLLELAEPATADGRLLEERIATWDGECGVDSLGCAAFVPVELGLSRAIFDDDLGDLARDWVGSGDSGQLLQQLLTQPQSPWWDDVDTPSTETATHVVSATFDRVGADLRAAFGEPRGWTWGRVHPVTFREATLGISGIGPLEWYFNAAARPAPGAAGAVNNNYYRLWRLYDDPYDEADVPVDLGAAFEVSNGPSYRLVIDMSDLDAARIVITTGQSGNPFDGHYGDLVDDWLAGETVALPFTEGAVQAAATSTFTLRP